MCLIAYAPKGQMVDRTILAYAYNQNPDGIGIMSGAGIEKFMGKKALKRARRYLESYLVPEKIPYAIHFRWATHGAVIMANTHPYTAPTGKHWVMHNGVIGLTTGEATKEESDTAVYVRKFMAEAPPFSDKQYYEAMSRHVGFGNKLCIMDDSGAFQLCNELQGDWIDGIWFSNTYSLPPGQVPTRSCVAARTYPSNQCGMDGYWRRDGWEPKEIWDYDTHSFMPNPKSKAADTVTAITKPAFMIEKADAGITVVHLLPKPQGQRWNDEDRRSYYENLERDMSPRDADYYDEALLPEPQTGLSLAQAAIQRDAEEADREAQRMTTGEEAALNATLSLRAAHAEKEDADIGGDFAPPGDVEEQTKLRVYLKKVAAGIYAS